MQTNIIGVGRLGKNLALALVDSGLIQLNAICNRDYHNAKLAVDQIGAGIAMDSLDELPYADLTFIVTPDDQIVTIAQRLAEKNSLTAGNIITHCSGTLNSDALKPLQEKGCQIASLHPLKAFNAGNLNKNAFKNCDFVIEGDKKAVTVLSLLFARLQANVIPIKKEAKILYHSAAVIASNYLITLAAISTELMQEAGIETSLAQQMTTRLMKSSFANLQEAETISAALTGPLARGDINTIKKHLQSLQNKPLIKSLYQTLALATLPMTHLNEEVKTILNQLFTK